MPEASCITESSWFSTDLTPWNTHQPPISGVRGNSWRRRRERGHRKTRYSIRAFEPEFRSARVSYQRQKRQGQSSRYKDGDRPDLSPTVDRLLALSELLDPIVLNVHLEHGGVIVNVVSRRKHSDERCELLSLELPFLPQHWLSGLSTLKRTEDVYYTHNSLDDWNNLDFALNVRNIRAYMT